jgi:prevent-host-death family protein
MRSVSIQEARQNLSKLLDAVERGESVLITRRGKPIARLVPAEPTSLAPSPDLTTFRASILYGGEPLSRTVMKARGQAQ